MGFYPMCRGFESCWGHAGQGHLLPEFTAEGGLFFVSFLALPVLECIDFVSDVGGVDQAPQYVVVEVAAAEGYAA